MRTSYFHNLAIIPLITIVACAPLYNDSPVVISDSPAPLRLFLQQVGSHSAIIKWRGVANQACWSSKKDGLSRAQCKAGDLTEGNHQEVLINNLAADTDYVYSIGDYTNDSLRFRTAPLRGQLPSDGSIHFWILGDSGTESAPVIQGHSNKGKAAKTRDGYESYREKNNSKPTDFILMLGDNAYLEGTDKEWQVAVFEVFTNALSQAAVYSTIGNHEMGAGIINAAHLQEKYPGLVNEQNNDLWLGGVSTSSDPNAYVTVENRIPRGIPYLDILTLPKDGELGGQASGTEQYYSFDYGNVHVVSLDSQLSARDEQQRLTMRKWLVSDLLNNDLDWTIIIFHHPVYTKGSHDSDTIAASQLGIDQPIINLRHEFTPIFENYGVDLVFSGHSHSYERSWYLHGHRGDASDFNSTQHAELNVEGKPASGFGKETYQQFSTSSQRDNRVVYTVAGSSGHVSTGGGELNHPAHAIQQNDPQLRHGLAEQGSVVVDANQNELIARFINEKGVILDTVVIQRD